MSFFPAMAFRIKNYMRKGTFAFIITLMSCHGNRDINQADKLLSQNIKIISTARRISLERKGGYTKVTIINPWQGANNLNMVYNLVRRGSAIPPGLDSSTVIFVPVKKIICMSTTQVAMISALGEENTISGMSGTDFIFSDLLAERAKQGFIKDVGYENNLNKELILNIKPDIIMMYGIGSESAGYVGKIQELGVKVVFNADYLESDPLSKTEWIKLFGALYCKEPAADSIYNAEAES